MLFNLSEYSSESVQDQLAHQIIAMIRKGDLSANSRLLPIHQLAQSQHVRIGAVRKSYQCLMSKGLIRLAENGHYYVSDRNSIGLSDQSAIPPVQNSVRGHKRPADSVKAKPGFTGRVAPSDLEKAREILSGLFPRTLPANRYISIHANTDPSFPIGGDLYDAFYLDRKKVAFLVADACGHGLSAALLIAQVRAIIRSCIEKETDPAKIVHHLNLQLWNSIPRNRFVTLFFAVYEFKGHRLTYINAGHPYPVLQEADTSQAFLDQSNPALGLLKDHHYRAHHRILRPGTMLLVYTDGLTEAMNPNKEEYGEMRLCRLIKKYYQTEPYLMIEKISNDVLTYTGNEEEEDDRTMLLLKVYN